MIDDSTAMVHSSSPIGTEVPTGLIVVVIIMVAAFGYFFRDEIIRRFRWWFGDWFHR